MDGTTYGKIIGSLTLVVMFGYIGYNTRQDTIVYRSKNSIVNSIEHAPKSAGSAHAVRHFAQIEGLDSQIGFSDASWDTSVHLGDRVDVAYKKRSFFGLWETLEGRTISKSAK